MRQGEENKNEQTNTKYMTNDDEKNPREIVIRIAKKRKEINV
jgi:hypothetical protein